MNKEFRITPLVSNWRAWANLTIAREWASTNIFGRWRWHDTTILPGYIALRNGEPVGLATYIIEADACELVTLNSFAEHIGIGGALLDTVRAEAARVGCKRLWLTTANDNLSALRFYQKRGLRIVAIHSGAVDVARRHKSGIPVIGREGIPLHDEIELAMPL